MRSPCQKGGTLTRKLTPEHRSLRWPRQHLGSIGSCRNVQKDGLADDPNRRDDDARIRNDQTVEIQCDRTDEALGGHLADDRYSRQLLRNLPKSPTCSLRRLPRWPRLAEPPEPLGKTTRGPTERSGV